MLVMLMNASTSWNAFVSQYSCCVAVIFRSKQEIYSIFLSHEFVPVPFINSHDVLISFLLKLFSLVLLHHLS